MRQAQSSITVCFWVFFVVAVPAGQRFVFSQDEKPKEVAGKADVLRHVPKKFATLTGADLEARRVELRVEGEQQSRTWDINPDAELKIHGWWGRLEQFETGDRVWVWFAIDRKKQPKSVLMLADEISEQDIHGLYHTLISYDAQSNAITIESKVSGQRALDVDDDLDLSEQIGKEIFVQSAGKRARTVATERQFETMRKQQQSRLCEVWRDSGLPATVSFLHPLGGEMEVTLDHEAIRWGRYLNSGDELTLQTDDPITAVVKHVRPWRERTQLRLVTDSGLDQADLSLGQRIGILVPEPPADVQQSDLPADIGRPKTKQQRIDWFLASTYCSCKIAGDRCTGMFYTLASCNVNACGMPNIIREKVAEMIDQQMTDQQIWHQLRELRGPQVMKQHLLR